MTSQAPLPPHLVGDGVHDDTPGIQALLDSGRSLVYLPPPPVHYLIRKTLVIHSGQELRLDRFTLVRLAPGGDCLMLTNAEQEKGDRDIAVIGGIWDMDNVRQAQNPIHPLIVSLKRDKVALPYDPERYLGFCMRFVHVTHLTVRGLTFRDPVTFATQFARLTHFTIDDITFDYRNWNPHPYNMDGIHLDGGCRFGRITNLQGTTYDDLVAINADDAEGESPCQGPIEDITIDGIYSRGCHSGVRFLSTGSPVRRINVSNLHGTYYMYAVGFTKWAHHRPTEGHFDAITLRNLHCAKAPREDWHNRGTTRHLPLVWFEKGTRVRNLRVENFARYEEAREVASFHVDPGARIDRLRIDNAFQESTLDAPVPFLLNEGEIGTLTLSGSIGPIENRGTIGHSEISD